MHHLHHLHHLLLLGIDFTDGNQWSMNVYIAFITWSLYYKWPFIPWSNSNEERYWLDNCNEPLKKDISVKYQIEHHAYIPNGQMIMYAILSLNQTESAQIVIGSMYLINWQYQYCCCPSVLSNSCNLPLSLLMSKFVKSIVYGRMWTLNFLN